jgi:hypothetical protein
LLVVVVVDPTALLSLVAMVEVVAELLDQQ